MYLLVKEIFSVKRIGFCNVYFHANLIYSISLLRWKRRDIKHKVISKQHQRALFSFFFLICIFAQHEKVLRSKKFRVCVFEKLENRCFLLMIVLFIFITAITRQ